MYALASVVGLLALGGAVAAPTLKRDVDTTYPYLGPEIPIGDPANPTLDPSKGGYPRLYEPPAVTPKDKVVTNNINVISTALFPGGVNIHFQTPFGIDCAPTVHYSSNPKNLNKVAQGTTHTYDRTPPCSMMDPTQCSQFFHEVQLTNLVAGKTYYYQIKGGNGTTPSDVLSVNTALAAGDKTEFSVAILADMGYTNANGTHSALIAAAEKGTSFVMHGGDISYADQWYGGMLPCVLTGPNAWDLCYNGTDTTLPGGKIDNPAYLAPVPEGEFPSQGSPNGGDISTVYETNWDLWQQWMNAITLKTPYMVAPGNHEAACAEFDGPNNELTAVLNENKAPGSHADNKTINYYSCPPSQRNFTAYQHRFHMPGHVDGGGVGNFWYSFDYGLVHFVNFNGETDFYKSPEWPFVADLDKEHSNATVPKQSSTFITDSGPFGQIYGSYKDNQAYEQYRWLKDDLAKVDRKKTPWIVAMSHRPMYSSQVSSYQVAVRNAFEDLFLENGVDVYISGHIHWYERLLPMGHNGTIVQEAVVDKNTYKSTKGSMVHIINGQAGNLESHSTLGKDTVKNFTAVLDTTNYGFTELKVFNATTIGLQFIRGDGQGTGDELVLIK